MKTLTTMFFILSFILFGCFTVIGIMALTLNGFAASTVPFTYAFFSLMSTIVLSTIDASLSRKK